ncbi:MAG TPA: fasciclin domain-containing protein [Actinoallomurus sp.]|nr:fasciclin domain-containing protein [Actinoallomurus sp.]
MKAKWIGHPAGAVAGVLAGGVALGIAEPFAAFAGGAQASPVIAVGAAAITLTPEWLKELAIRHFGTNDKLALLVGLSAGITVLALVIGIVARRRLVPGLVGFILSTLVTAVKKAGLVDTLNSAQNITVFAPDNDAFAKIPKKTLNKMLADKKTLSSILTYHVVGQKVAPDALGSGSFKTLQGGMVTTSGSGESYKVNDSNVVCGNVQTANATVYIIDTVMMPKR